MLCNLFNENGIPFHSQPISIFDAKSIDSVPSVCKFIVQFSFLYYTVRLQCSVAMLPSPEAEAILAFTVLDSVQVNLTKREIRIVRINSIQKTISLQASALLYSLDDEYSSFSLLFIHFLESFHLKQLPIPEIIRLKPTNFFTQFCTMHEYQARIRCPFKLLSTTIRFILLSNLTSPISLASRVLFEIYFIH